jgi:serine/threonine-protein kinase RsbW
VTLERAESIQVRSEVSELERLFAFIEQFCKRTDTPDALKYKLFLVAEELAMNAISHGYAGRADGPIALTLIRRDPEIELHFEDEAPPFDSLRDAREPDLDASVADRRIGGLGIHLLKVLSRSASYAYERGRNVVRVTLEADAEPNPE